MEESKKSQLVAAITDMCAGCAADGNIGECPDSDCPLWMVRLGAVPGRKGSGWLTRQIRTRCLECTAWQAREVLCCAATGCPLWPWRSGTGIPERFGESKGIDALLNADMDPNELSVNDILFGED